MTSFEALPTEIICEILQFTNLQTLINLFQVNKCYLNLKSQKKISDLKQLLLSKTKKIGISKRSVIGGVIHGMIPGPGSRKNYRGSRIQKNKATDIHQIGELISKYKKFIIISGPSKADNKIVLDKYVAVKFTCMDNKFIYYDPTVSFSFRESELDLFFLSIGRMNIKQLVNLDRFNYFM